MMKMMVPYEHILRAIGQGLEALSVEGFELEATNEIFVVQGAATQKEPEPNTGKLSAFKKLFWTFAISRRSLPPRKIQPEKVVSLLVRCG
jgi:hypothetical protein